MQAPADYELLPHQKAEAPRKVVFFLGWLCGMWTVVALLFLLR